MIEIKVGKRDAIARVLDVELVRIRRNSLGNWAWVGPDGKAVRRGFLALAGATDDGVRAWLDQQARERAARGLDGARNALRFYEDQLARARQSLAAAEKALTGAETEVPKARERLAHAERIMEAIGGPK